MFKITETQLQAKELIESNQNVLTISGAAGTGKTLIAAMAAQSLASQGKRVLVTSFTAKAALRLREVFAKFDLDHSNITIKNYHQVIYKLIVHPQPNGTNKISFERQHDWQYSYDCIIVDESSMIDNQTFKDIVRSRLPVTFVGDNNQLPPVGGSSIIDKPNFTLTEVHRQSDTSYILDVAISLIARDDKPLSRVQYINTGGNDVFESIDKLDDWVALFYSNKDRIAFNIAYRAYKYSSYDGLPVVGDKCIVLRNMHDHGLFNGTTVEIVEVIPYHEEYIKLVIRNGDTELRVIAPVNQFNSVSLIDCGKQYGGLPLINLDYAYALTCHKAQGSEYENVLIRAPLWVKKRDPITYWRWVYTAVTRAKKNIYLV